MTDMLETHFASTHTDALPALEWVSVTPEIAAAMLAANTHNRNPKRQLRQYAEDMRSGAWRHEACDPLRFSSEGVLLDGQNRLMAVIESGCTIPFLVVRGLSPETQTVMDSGVSRTLSDVLNLNGEDHHQALAAVTRLAWDWNRGPGSLFKGKASNSQLLKFLDENPELREYSGQMVKGTGAACHLPPAIVGVLWWRFRQIDSDDADHFFSRLASETGHQETEPIYELRRTLKNANDGGVRGRRGLVNRTWLMAVTIKAWNAYRAGQTVRLYRWSPGGKSPEAFPTPI
jgi:hypothetical protein